MIAKNFLFRAFALISRDTHLCTEKIERLAKTLKTAIISSMRNLRYNIIYRPEPGGGFTVTVPALSGCVTYGKDIEEARRMARDAVSGYIASLKKHKEPIPLSDTDGFLGSIELTAPARSLDYA